MRKEDKKLQLKLDILSQEIIDKFEKADLSTFEILGLLELAKFNIFILLLKKQFEKGGK